MKKYLLTAFLGLFGFIGTFTSAVDINSSTTTVNFVKNDYNNYTPAFLSIQKNFDLTLDDIKNYSCDEYSSLIFSKCDSEYEDCTEVCYFSYDDLNEDSELKWSISSDYNNCNFSNGDFLSVNREEYACDSITIDFSSSAGGGDTTEGGSIIQGGIDTFTPVISRMLEIAGEFIPYIVYIFIGYLGVILLWKAVKYILGYLKGKSEGTFENREKHYVKRDGGMREETEEERQTRLEDEKFLRERKEKYGY